MAVHVEINPEFNDRSVMVSANDLKRNLERSGNESADAWARGFEKAGPRVQQAYEKAYSGASNAASTLRAEEAKLADVRARAQRSAEELAKAEEKVAHYRANLPNLTATIAAEESKLNDIRQRHNSTLAELTVRTESASRAFTNQSSAISDLGRAFNELESGGSAATESMSGLGKATAGLGATGPIAAVAVAALGVAVFDLAGVAASAAQSILLLPAAVGAAGAAFGTLELATLGFGDAIKAVGDPQKFGEALRQLAPSAQQAAASIQALMPEFEQLKNATQDTLFAGVGQQLNQLTNQYLPAIQSMTTGIAGAFNSAFQGVADQLMTPETQQAIQEFTKNVTQAFQNLAPAVAPLTKAFADLMSVGSSFLPDLAKAASDAAQAFSTFITQARMSGDLQKWMSEGLSTLKQLGGIAYDVGRAFLAMAPAGERILPQIADGVKWIADHMPQITMVVEAVTEATLKWQPAIKTTEVLVGAVQSAFEKIEPVIDRIGDAINTALAPLRALAEFAGVPIPDGSNSKGGGYLGQHGGYVSKDGPPTAGIPGVPDGGYGLPYAGAGRGVLGQQGAIHQGLNPGGYHVAGTDTPWKPSTSSSGPKLPTAPVTAYNSSLPAGFAGLPQSASLFSAESSYMDANTGLAEKQARLDQLQKSNVATADQIQKARNDVITAEHTQHEAELRLYAQRDELYNKNAKQMQGYASQMGEIGVKLDQDLGISKGLAGIADNLVRFVGSLALAPWEAQMQAITNAPGQAQGGFGLMGILGAQGAFGPQYTAAGQAAASGNGASALGPAALMPGASAGGEYGLPAGTNTGGYGSGGKGIFPDWVQRVGAAFGVTPSTYAGHQETDRHEAGYAPNPSHENRGIDWSGTPQAMQRFADYLKNVPGMEQVIWNGGGVGTGDTVEIAGGRPQPGYFAGDLAGHGNHVHTRQSTPIPLPGGATADYAPAPAAYDSSVAAPTTVVAGAMPASSALSGLPIPLPVTIVGGGGGFGGGSPFGFPGTPGGAPGDAAPGTPASGQGFGPAPGPFGGGDPNVAAPTPGGGIGWGSPLPPMPAGAGGQGFGPGASIPGSIGQGTGPGAAPGTQIGAAVAPAGGTGKGGVGASDSTMALAGMAASALDVMAPGAGQAAQIGMKLANRAVQYGGQVAGIGVQGLMQTFLPTGGSELANNSWASKLIGGLAGAAPALPNMAGKPAAPPAPGQGQQGGQGQQPGGDTHITVNNQRQTEDGTGKDIAWNMQNMYQPAGKP